MIATAHRRRCADGCLVWDPASGGGVVGSNGLIPGAERSSAACSSPSGVMGSTTTSTSSGPSSSSIATRACKLSSWGSIAFGSGSPRYSTDAITGQELAAQAQRTSTRHFSAEDQALAALPDTEIMAAMQSLPEQFRAVVYYADVEGFRYREIADIMGTPHGTVMSRLHRGRQHLRRLLADAAHPGRRRRVPAVRDSARCTSIR
jgi:hypothetical protein